ncbi:MAG: hypothetical protein EBY01_04270, partial [Actinobacteria bacterium]|nr:hypothetical protein [Actinomycetota bacterium]
MAHSVWVLALLAQRFCLRLEHQLLPHLLQFMSQKSGVELCHIKHGGSREPKFVIARRSAIRVLRNHAKLGLAKIGQILGGYDHTTVLYHLQIAQTPQSLIEGEQE